MKEYRIRAYFNSIYTDRTYKRKVMTDLAEARRVLEEAKLYYRSRPYADKLVKVQLESREVAAWEAE